MDKEKSLMSVGQFAEVLNVTPACIRRWILLRRIATIKLGRLIRIPSSEVERLVEAGHRPASRSPYGDA
jgi:excisionase family DNA binding protein